MVRTIFYRHHQPPYRRKKNVYDTQALRHPRKSYRSVRFILYIGSSITCRPQRASDTYSGITGIEFNIHNIIILNRSVVQDEQTVQVRRKGRQRQRPRSLRVPRRWRENARVQLQFASWTRVHGAKSRNSRSVNIN